MGKSVLEQMRKQTSFTPAEYLRLHDKKRKIPLLPVGMVLIDAEEYAKRTGYTVKQVRILCSSGSIEYTFKPGKEWRIGVWKE